MDLRPINPYYHKRTQKRKARAKYTSNASAYSYPYEWITPVTDRTQADVEYAQRLRETGWTNLAPEEQKEYLAGLKGCLNTSDLLRIENDIQILLDVLELDGTSYVNNVPALPTASYFGNLSSNVTAIREAYCVHADTPQVPALPYNTWQAYNAIEQILNDVYEVVSAQFSYYAGNEIYAGDTIGLLL